VCHVEENFHASVLAHSAKPNPDFYGFLDYNIDFVDVALCQLGGLNQTPKC